MNRDTDQQNLKTAKLRTSYTNKSGISQPRK